MNEIIFLKQLTVQEVQNKQHKLNQQSKLNLQQTRQQQRKLLKTEKTTPHWYAILVFKDS